MRRRAYEPELEQVDEIMLTDVTVMTWPCPAIAAWELPDAVPCPVEVVAPAEEEVEPVEDVDAVEDGDPADDDDPDDMLEPNVPVTDTWWPM